MKARAHDDIGGVEAAEHAIEIGRIMLAISVDLNHRLIPLALGVKEGRAHRAANPDIEGERDHYGPGLLSTCGCVVGRTIVDDEDVGVGAVLANLGDDVGDGTLLIPGRDRNEHALASHKGSR